MINLASKGGSNERRKRRNLTITEYKNNHKEDLERKKGERKKSQEEVGNQGAYLSLTKLANY